MDKTAKRLNKEQIERLYTFTRQHFVEHYDLQTELVDHLAHGIEERWEQQPGLDFEKALQAEFKKFGIFGFQDVIEKRHASLNKRYYKLLWGYFRDFLGLPKIMLSIGAAGLIYLLLRLSVWIYIPMLLIVLIGSVIRLTRIRKKHKKKVEQTGKRWILEDIIFNAGGMGHLLYVPIQSMMHIKEPVPDMLLWAMSALIVLLLIYDYVVLFIIPKKAEQHLLETYPEYRLELFE